MPVCGSSTRFDRRTQTLEVTITSGTEPWFASSGVYDVLTSVDKSLYVIVPVSGDVEPSYGT
jgi:hypothetical protein